jgi:AraC-like DNA-binding protein
MAGRKAYIPRDDDVEKVRAMASAGERNGPIAEALGVSIPTLQKKFGPLLRETRASSPTEMQLPLGEGAAVQPIRTPTRPKGKSTGRKRYEPSDRDRKRVALLLADNQRKDLIARLMGVSLPTFEKAFADEIEMASISLVAANLERLEKAASAGKVAAMKHLQDRLDNAAAARRAPAAPAPSEKPKEETPGKKAAAHRRAADVAATGMLGDLTRPIRPSRPN